MRISTVELALGCIDEVCGHGQIGDVRRQALLAAGGRCRCATRRSAAERTDDEEALREVSMTLVHKIGAVEDLLKTIEL